VAAAAVVVVVWEADRSGGNPYLECQRHARPNILDVWELCIGA
jgi:hypothetical protein